ncbi:MAG: sulfotransferase [Actinomycetota bacterium]|nr:sulfotransferase [Actinomycetota bacterium]
MSSLADSPLHESVIFNLGSRRSGTYWLQRIVTAHPSVGSVPSETHLISHGIAPLLERFHQGERDSTLVGSVYCERERLIRALRHLCDEVFGQFLEHGQRRLAERTPLHVFHLGLISEIYPDARCVHIIRDGRDVARSIAAQDWGPNTVADAAREWRDAVSAGRSAGLGPDRYLEVRYEALLSDPESQIAGLYEWLGLPTSPADLSYPLAASRRPENVDRFGVGGIAVGKWRSSFRRGDLAAFMDVAGDLLAELGYSSHNSVAQKRYGIGALRKRIRS